MSECEWKSLSCVRLFATPWTIDPWNSPGQNTGVGSLSLPQGTQLCLTLCNPMDCDFPGSSIHGISQARILEWIAISYSSGSSRPKDWTWVSCTGRQILYHLSHQGSPHNIIWEIIFLTKYMYIYGVSTNMHNMKECSLLWLIYIDK